MRFADLDAVTVDGFGTLLRLVSPLEALRDALLEHGLEHDAVQIENAFAAEASHYRPRSHLGRDPRSLEQLRRECAAVFLDTLGAELDPAEFADPFVRALRFEAIPGAAETVDGLRRRGLRTAVVANWDVALHEHLRALGLTQLFDAVVTSAEAGAPKPDPRIFELALARLQASPGRAVHVGDEQSDEEGARAAGMRFAPAPLSTAFSGWT
jgi:putative hydrolase of the HAD superfamily